MPKIGFGRRDDKNHAGNGEEGEWNGGREVPATGNRVWDQRRDDRNHVPKTFFAGFNEKPVNALKRG